MKILVLCSDYPNLKGGVSLNYVHTRNIAYKIKWGVDVTVLNFKSIEGYVKDGIKVITLRDFENNIAINYDILVCHAANLKNHYRFLYKYNRLFSKIVFFYHGHEVMKLTEEYPKEYEYKKKNYLKESIIPIYDSIKFKVWKRFLLNNIQKLQLVFVSEWMYDVFKKNIGIKESFLDGKINIIYNSVSKVYEKMRYDITSQKEYDYVTIRPNIDTSKFGIDIVNRFAKASDTKLWLEFYSILCYSCSFQS